MNFLGIKSGKTAQLAAANPFSQPPVLLPQSEQQPPTEEPPQRQAIFLGPRWEPINISSNATAQGVQTAIREAENGETRELFRFYRDIILGDDHVQGCLNARKIALLSEPVNFMPEDKDNPDDVAAAAAARRAMNDCENWNDALSTLLSSCFWPVKVMERLYRPADPARGKEPQLLYTFRKFEDVNPTLFCFRWAYYTGGLAMGSASPLQQANLGIRQNPFEIDLERWEPYFKLWPTDNSGRIIYDAASAQYLDTRRHIVHRNHLLTEYRDNWGGPGRAIMGWWLLRQLGRDWFAQFMQTYGKPFVKMKVDIEDEQAIAFARQALDMARRIGGLVIDHEDEAELVAAMVQGGAEGHKTWGELCNSAISRHLCGQEMSSTAKSGSETGSSQAALQGSVRDDIAKWDQRKMGETVIKQIINPFLLLNGLPGRVTSNWGGQSSEEAEATGDLLVNLKNAGLQPAKDQLPVISERVGFTVERAAEPVAPAPGGNPAAEPPDDDEETARLGAAGVPIKKGTPIDFVIARKSADLAAAFRGARAPVIAILQSSSSAEDFAQKLSAHYADWSPERVAGTVEEALHLAAAKALAGSDRSV